jgi:hypothetical protein
VKSHKRAHLEVLVVLEDPVFRNLLANPEVQVVLVFPVVLELRSIQ